MRAIACVRPKRSSDAVFLTRLSLLELSIVLVVVPTLLAMATPILIRRWIGLDRLRINNEVAGFKFATVGVLYAVLMAFAVIVVWEKFADAEADVAREAGAAATIYRLIDGIEGDVSRVLHQDMTVYLEAAINEDWPAMERGHGSDAVTRSLDNLYAAALAYKPTDQRGMMVFSEVLQQINAMTEARRARLVKASGIVPGIIWIVLCFGAFVTVGFTFFFGAANVRAQSIMTGGVTMLIFCGLFVIVAIDHPFAGTVKVQPEALVDVLHDLAKHGTGAK